MENKITAAEAAKAAGLSGLNAITELTGTPRNTLDHWYKNKPGLFRIVVAGAVAIAKEQEAEAKGPVDIPVFFGTEVGEVKNWLASLHRVKMLWHMDEHPAEIVFACRYKPEGKALEWLELSRQNALRVCADQGADIFTLYPKGILPDPEK